MPPPPEAGRVDVDNVRRVAGEVLLRKGHIERDCLRRVSMIARRPIPDIPIEVAFDKEQVVEEVSSYSESKMVKTVRRTMTPLWVGVSRGFSRTPNKHHYAGLAGFVSEIHESDLNYYQRYTKKRYRSAQAKSWSVIKESLFKETIKSLRE